MTTSAEKDPGIAVFRGQPMLLLYGTWVWNRRIIAEPAYLSLGAVLPERRFPVEKW